MAACLQAQISISGEPEPLYTMLQGCVGPAAAAAKTICSCLKPGAVRSHTCAAPHVGHHWCTCSLPVAACPDRALCIGQLADVPLLLHAVGPSYGHSPLVVLPWGLP